MEAQHEIVTYEDGNVTKEFLIYNVTSLRVNPDYMLYYIHWTRLLSTGVIPFLFLSSMNLMIYLKIRQTNNSSIRNRSNSIKKTNNLAFVLIIIGEKIF